ncbi:hypothetical protein CNECB9_2200033 [Cupriavidus necator]|uniref:Uncharacterized protein n=1 Tax=Cupriavidus necator TaxID=106590 RepID=A0A1K0JIJ7_CUPNE|nr:hypothetical protein CNECB9_2200033 [Cupriavidus necator]
MSCTAKNVHRSDSDEVNCINQKKKKVPRKREEIRLRIQVARNLLRQINVEAHCFKYNMTTLLNIHSLGLNNTQHPPVHCKPDATTVGVK